MLWSVSRRQLGNPLYGHKCLAQGHSFLRPAGGNNFPPLHSLALVRRESCIQRRGGPASGTGVFLFFCLFIWLRDMGYVAKPNHNGETGGWWKRVSLQTRAHHTSSRSTPTITNPPLFLSSSSRSGIRTSSGSWLSVWRYPCSLNNAMAPRIMPLESRSDHPDGYYKIVSVDHWNCWYVHRN